MLTELAATWTAIRTATEAISTALKTVDGVKAKEAVIDIQNSLIDVQTKLMATQTQYEALAEIKREAEQKLVDYENWDTEARRYQLKEIAKGIFVYELKSDDKAGEPPHWLCPYCFQQHKKSILSRPSVNTTDYKCYKCTFEFIPKEWQPTRVIPSGY